MNVMKVEKDSMRIVIAEASAVVGAVLRYLES